MFVGRVFDSQSCVVTCKLKHTQKADITKQFAHVCSQQPAGRVCRGHETGLGVLRKCIADDAHRQAGVDICPHVFLVVPDVCKARLLDGRIEVTQVLLKETAPSEQVV